MVFIFYHYRHIEEEHLQERLFLEMKNYAIFFKGDRFDVDLLSASPDTRYFELLQDDTSLYILVPLPQTDSQEALKIYYPISRYRLQIAALHRTLMWQFAALSIIAAMIALLFSWYVLHPLRLSLHMTERFIKDIIHDINTPLSAILINLKMMERTEETQSIAQSAHTLAMLQRNLDAYLKEHIGQRERFYLLPLVEEQVAFFAPMYERLTWKITIDRHAVLYSDKDAFGRILYNLLSNACKYNTPDGHVHITLQGTMLYLQNTTHGIRHPHYIFERFYKEGERGLGIGLHIVRNLTQTLNIPIRVETHNNTVTFVLNLRKVTQN